MAAAAEETGSSISATANAAEEAGVIKNKAQTTEMQTEPSTGLTAIDLAINPLTAIKAGVTTAARPRPASVPTIVAANGTNTISKGVLPERYLPNSAAINAAQTAETGCPVLKTPVPAA